MTAVVVWQQVLGGLGWVLAKLYDLVGNYGIAIILLTLGIRVLLLPLGIKQIRSMQQMQHLQPKIKDLQRKHKGDKQKQQEEMMKLYQEHGVSPFGSCLPMLAQFPVLIALYAVLRPPVPGAAIHLPVGSNLYNAIVVEHTGTDFLWLNLQCSPTQAGLPAAEIKDIKGKVVGHVDCGNGAATRIPYYLLLGVMIGITYYSTRQMQKAAPPGAQQQQQKTLMYMMPLVFGFIGLRFPAGLILYWTTSTAFQVGQQHFMLSALRKEKESESKRDSDGKGASRGRARKSSGRAADPSGVSTPPRKGFLAKLQDQAERQREERLGGSSGSQGSRQSDGSAAGEATDQPRGSSSGGNSGSRKKRRKR